MAFKDERFGFDGGEISDATGEAGWADGFIGVVSTPAIATEGDPFDFTGEPRGDFSSGKLGPLGRVSAEDKSDASLIGLKASILLGLEENNVLWPLLQQRRPQAGWLEAE